MSNRPSNGIEFGPDADMPSSNSAISAAFDLLSHPQRRRMLRFLYIDGNRSTDFDTLIIAMTRELELDTVERSTLEMETHHRHLPKLSDYDVIEYDTTTGRIRYTGNAFMESILDRLEL